MKVENNFLDITNLSISYKNGTQSIDVCHNFNMNLKAGEVVGILGPNGSGKSSLINAILNEISYKGKIKFDGHEKLRPKIAYIPQDYKSSFFTWTSLKNNIRFTQSNFYKKWNKWNELIENEKANLGINFDLSLKPKNCSGGMLQQAAILRAICSHDGLILADEPFSALDVNINRIIRANFRKIIKQKSIACLFVLHSMDDILAVCDRLIVIPNKPYTTSKKAENLFEIKEFLNSNITNNYNADSILEIASKVFQDK